MKLQVSFFDDGGRRIECFEAEVAEATERVANFLLLHGADPDEGGACAKAGRIEFSPVAEDIVRCRKCERVISDDEVREPYRRCHNDAIQYQHVGRCPAH